jgi:hypothetical protein
MGFAANRPVGLMTPTELVVTKPKGRSVSRVTLTNQLRLLGGLRGRCRRNRPQGGGATLSATRRRDNAKMSRSVW